MPLEDALPHLDFPVVGIGATAGAVGSDGSGRQVEAAQDCAKMLGGEGSGV